MRKSQDRFHVYLKTNKRIKYLNPTTPLSILSIYKTLSACFIFIKTETESSSEKKNPEREN